MQVVAPEADMPQFKNVSRWYAPVLMADMFNVNGFCWDMGLTLGCQIPSVGVWGNGKRP